MTEETFIELVDLYLDREITKEDLLRLKAELAVNADLRQLFLERSRLHKAMQMALNPQMRRKAQRAQRAQKAPAAGRSRASGFGQTPFGGLRWFLGTGLAASLVFGWILFSSTSLMRSDSQPNAQGFSSVSEPISDFVDEALSKWTSEADLKRYASRQERGLANERTSLAAQLRLMGLRPELTPQDKELRSIDLAALQSGPTRSQAELLTALQRHSVMPESRILRYAEPVEADVGFPARTYGSGFQSSLISFR